MNRAAVALWLLTLASLLAFGWFVWPTRYEYLDGPFPDVVLRVDRISGEVQYWARGSAGWFPFTK